MNTITSRVQAIEDLLRQDDASDEESFDYDAFIRNRNNTEQKEAPQPTNVEQIKDQFKLLVDAPDTLPETQQETSRRPFAIDSDSESDNDEDEAVPETNRRLAAIASSEPSSPEPEEALQMPASSPSKHVLSEKVASTSGKNANKSRKSRALAEQELARMKRQLDIELEIHTKAKPSLSEFLGEFNAQESRDQPQEESDFEILSDPDTCPTSPLPFKAPIFHRDVDKRDQWLRALQLQQDQQQLKRFEENTKEFDIEQEDDDDDEDVLEIEEVDEESNLPEPVARESMAQEASDIQTSLDDIDAGSIQNNSDELELSGKEDELASQQQQEQDQGSITDDDAPSSAATMFNETQVEEPLDPETLRRLYQKQRKIFNDSDSEDDSEDEINAGLQTNTTRSAPSRDEIEQLSASQQQAELRRRFQMNREMALEMFEEQAQESDEDLDITNNATDEDEDENDETPVENLIDDTKQEIKEDDLHKMFVEKERLRDEELTKKIRKNIIGGGWRNRKLYDETGMLSDSDEDEESRSRNMKRIKRLERQKLLEHSTLGRLAAKEKTKAFAESMVEQLIHHDTLEDDSCQSIQESLRFLMDDMPQEDQESNRDPVLSRPAVSSSRSSAEFATEQESISILPAARKSTEFLGSRPRQRDSVLTRPLPSTHKVPVLPSKHVTKRAKIADVAKKHQKPSFKSIGLGYKATWT